MNNTLKMLNNFNEEQFEKQYVEQVYSQIAEHFDKTRYHSWPKIRQFVDNLPSGITIYDIGCGNGRNMNIRPDCYFVGYDNNQQLIDQAVKKNHKCLLGNNLSLPINDHIAEAVMSIAVIHHFCNQQRRIQALRELFRILKPGGQILIYVWAKEQEKFKNDDKDTFLKWTNQKDNSILYRYYYLFNQNELDNLIINYFPEISIIESGEQCNNWYIIGEKKNE